MPTARFKVAYSPCFPPTLCSLAKYLGSPQDKEIFYSLTALENIFNSYRDEVTITQDSDRNQIVHF